MKYQITVQGIDNTDFVLETNFSIPKSLEVLLQHGRCVRTIQRVDNLRLHIFVTKVDSKEDIIADLQKIIDAYIKTGLLIDNKDELLKTAKKIMEYEFIKKYSENG